MSQEATPTPLPPLGEHRPTRAESTPAEGAGTTTHLLLRPEDGAPKRTETIQEEAPCLRPADPEAAPPGSSRHAVRRTASVVGAFGAHVLVLLALITAPGTEFGEGGDSLEAISVSIIPASALDARQPTTDISASAAPAHVAPNPGEESVSSEATPEKAAPPEPKAEQPAAETPEPAQQLAAPAEAAPETVTEEALEITRAPAPPEETKVAEAEPARTPPEQPPEEKPREERPAPPSQAAMPAGGATSHGMATDQPPRAAAAAASRGQINAYGMAVQSALLAVDQRAAKARVSASQAKGTVVVKLALDDKGGLVSVEVVKSSGRPQLDDAALLLIRLAAFPPPPPGLTAAERSYLAPIRFR